MDILDIMMAKKLSGGGGSGDSKAVKYTKQTLTEQQQMQARDNLGLYGKNNISVSWDGDVTGRIIAKYAEFQLYKVSDFYFNSKPASASIKQFGSEELLQAEITDLSNLMDFEIYMCFISDASMNNLIVTSSAAIDYAGVIVFPEAGTYMIQNTESLIYSSLNLIPSEYIDLNGFAVFKVSAAENIDGNRVTHNLIDCSGSDIGDALNMGLIPILKIVETYKETNESGYMQYVGSSTGESCYIFENAYPYISNRTQFLVGFNDTYAKEVNLINATQDYVNQQIGNAIGGEY